ncbi:MAG: hypothetical protein IJ740_19440 [Ruminococcus sp.]|nr:hypothetical protein [Ruminococcus sp.]
MKIKKTYTFSENAVRMLELLSADRDTPNHSELLRILIAEECVRRGLISSVESAGVELPETETRRSDIADAVDRMDAVLKKMQYRLNTIEKICYQSRDGINTYLNFLEISDSAYVSADEDISPTANSCIHKSGENYERSKRNLAVDKRNFRK